MLCYAKSPLPFGLPRPRSYSHLLFRPTLALPVPVTGVGVLGKPLLPLPLSKLNLRDVLPLNAFCTSGLPLYGLPDPALVLAAMLLSMDPLLSLPVSGDSEKGDRELPRPDALERGVADRE